MHTLKPRPATPRGWSGGSTAIYFLREKEGLEPVQTLVPIAANARTPKMTNAAPRIFLQEGRFAVVRCAIHQGHQCGRSGLVQVQLLLTQKVIAAAASGWLSWASTTRSGRSIILFDQSLVSRAKPDWIIAWSSSHAQTAVSLISRIPRWAGGVPTAHPPRAGSRTR